MNLEDLEIYQLAMEIGEKIWGIVTVWDDISKRTIGMQLIRAVDSISANISEGFGRYHYKEAKQFSYYARGSLFETKTWLRKASNRKLVNPEEFSLLMKQIDVLGIKLNNYIRAIGKNN